ncbi:MAG: FAD-dependent monooxygenase [Ramlibacter sp.]
MTPELLVAGGGIGGLAAALAATRAGCTVRVFEQAAEFAEIGAGIQLGPNATRLLHGWGLEPALAQVAAAPQRLVVRRVGDGARLAVLALGAAFAARYGAPYLTVHRAVLHGVLLRAAAAAGASLQTGQRIVQFSQPEAVVRLELEDRREIEGDVLVVADGIWSRLRAQLLGDGPAHATGHLAYRALLDQRTLPQHLRSQEVCVWLGPHSHTVAYPVRGGESLNLVVVVEGGVLQPLLEWGAQAAGADLQAVLGGVCKELQELVQAAAQWGVWSLHERAPVHSAEAMAQGRVALLGDAAHPMRPYLAQGAAMALEDAAELARVLTMVDGRVVDVPLALRRYALNRWQRCARVQRVAQRNASVFHATGPLQWGRDAALRLLGRRLLDQPWLYGGPN